MRSPSGSRAFRSRRTTRRCSTPRRSCLVCLRPQVAREALAALRFRPDHVVISAMAGISVDELRRLIAPATDVARCIPLPAVARRAGITPIHPPQPTAKALFDRLGSAVEVPGPRRLRRLRGRHRDDRRPLRVPAHDQRLARRARRSRRGGRPLRRRDLRRPRDDAGARARLLPPRPRPRHAGRHQRALPRHPHRGRRLRRGADGNGPRPRPPERALDTVNTSTEGGGVASQRPLAGASRPLGARLSTRNRAKGDRQLRA